MAKANGQVANGGQACTLPYPERFHAAVAFVVNPPPAAKPIPDEMRLVLYGLHQQATLGPCTESKPWGWNVVESAKWQSWSSLGNMSQVEAMRLYVRVLDEEQQPDWWHLVQQQQAAAASPAKSATTNGPASPAGQASLADGSGEGGWYSPAVAGAKRPPPRYEHAVAAIGAQMVVVGGNCGGRYLNDVWVLDLERLAWRALESSPSKPASPASQPAGEAAGDASAAASPALPPVAGHVLVAWRSTLLCVGGHARGRTGKAAAGALMVRALDTNSWSWSLVTPAGDVPPSRGSHTATLVGSKVFIFGGEDAARRPTGELFVLDLQEMAWQRPETTGKPPAPRSAHIATAYAGRYLLIFGGGSVAHCYNDLHCLDTQTMEWSQPAVEGPVPSPRAGHAGDLLGRVWYVVGGGNNTSGCTDLVALDLAPLGSDRPLSWAKVAEAEVRSPIASEGLSLQAIPHAGCIIAFGGYNGKYHNSLQVYRPGSSRPPSPEHARAPAQQSPQHKAAPKQPESPSKQAASAADAKAQAEAAAQAKEAAAKAQAAKNARDYYASQQAASDSNAGTGDLRARSEAAAAELASARAEAAAAKESAAHELALMRRQLASAQTAQAQAEKTAQELRSALAAEQRKAMKVEVQLAEATRGLARLDELEKELEHYRFLAKEAEASKGKGSLWGYISGQS